MTLKNTLYDQDFYAWTQVQAELLRDRRFAEADIDNLVEEIDSMGKQQQSELVSRLSILLAHLLKWQFQPQMRSRSRLLSIKDHRFQVARHLKQNPSFKSYQDEGLVEAFQLALLVTQRETDLDAEAFPAACTWSWNEILSPDFLPLNAQWPADHNH